jgi:soluble lytic murein transglycosylase-like protein
MPRLPTQYDLSQQPGLRSGRQVATYDASGIGRGLERLGAGLSDAASTMMQQQNAVDLSRAEAYKTKGILDVKNQFVNDPEYSTFSKRGDPTVDKTVTDAANLIRDPRMRERWQAEAQKDAVVAKDWLIDQSTQKKRGAEIAALNDANNTNYNIAIDPNTPEDVRTKARADLAGSIDMAEKSGLIAPEDAQKARVTLLQGGYDEQAKLAAQAGQLNLPNVDTLAKAMTGVESGGDPNAESNKGAIGLMQVEPATAAGIAKEIGDTNFPADLEKQKEYLKNPDVSMTYGKRYLGDMLTKYHGDEEAALIAYNGGPARADAWLKAGRDDSVLPQETSDYYRKVMAGMGPTGKFDSQQQAVAKSYLQAHTDKGPEAIQGLNGDFSVKLANLFQNAPPELKDKLGIFSGYRTPEQQATIIAKNMSRYGLSRAAWEADVAQMGAVKAGEKWEGDFRRTGLSSEYGRPGGSNHQKGLAADLSFNGESLAKAPQQVVDWVHQNAGKFGLKFRLENENWHIEDDSTSTGPTKSYPIYWQKVSPQARQQAFDIAGEVERKQQMQDLANLKATQQQAQDDFNLRIAASPTAGMRSEILQSPNMDNGQKATLLNSLNSALKENAGVSDLISMLGNGQSVNINPFNEEVTKVANKAFEQMMASTTEDKRPALTSSFISQTGYIPKMMQAEVRRANVTQSVPEMTSALTTADQLQRLAPTSFQSMDGHEQVQKNLDAYRHLTNDMGYTTDEAARKVIALNDPEQVRQRDAVMKSKPVTDFIKTVDSSTVAGLFGSRLPFSSPNVGETANQQQLSVGYSPEGEQAIVADYKGILEESIADAGGDTTLGKKMADDRFMKLYGPSQFTIAGKTVSKLPPEKTYPADINGSYDYIRNQAMDDLKKEKIDATGIYLMPYEQTERDFNAGKPANYQLFYEQDGQFHKYQHPFVADPAAANQTAVQKSAETQKGNVQNELEIQRRMNEAAKRKEGSPDWMKAQEMQNEYQKMQEEKRITPSTPNGNLEPSVSPEDQLFNQ